MDGPIICTLRNLSDRPFPQARVRFVQFLDFLENFNVEMKSSTEQASFYFFIGFY